MIRFLLGMLTAYCLLGWADVENTTKRMVIPLHHKFDRSIAAVGKPVYNGIIGLTKPNGQFFCTAFVIDVHYAVTAAHCISDGTTLKKTPIFIRDDQGKSTNIQVTAAGFSNRSDFGLLLGDFSKFRVVEANFTDYSFNNKHKYAACGFPYGQTKMVCNDFIPTGTDLFLVTGKGYLTPGQSGGPVIDKTTGLAVGINSQACETGSCFGVYPLQGYLGAFNIE